MADYSRQLKYQAKKNEQEATIAGLPAVEDPDRKERCRYDLLAWLTEYFPHSTGLKPFSEDHKKAIIRMQYAILEGGSVVLTCFPRGFAKTTISENTALWATLYGHRKFVPIIGADKGASNDNIDSLKFELTENDLIVGDFPEICIPFKALDNKSQRCANQKFNDHLTYIRWSAEELGFPWMMQANGEYTQNSGAVFRCIGITGRIRGMAIKNPDGTKMRPDFFILDDPQTDESALSPAQCDKRLGIYQKSILRLGGHHKLLSGLINATVIEPEDMVDTLLSQEKHPEVEGVRIPMLKSMSSNHEDLWMGTYAEIRRTYNPEDPRDRRRAIKEATAFYRDNREAMDAGAEATWVHCYAEDDGELSAIQHAYNILIDDGPVVFASECQNAPINRNPAGLEFLTPKQILDTRVGDHSNKFPRTIETVTFHIDVGRQVLYYCVTGFSDDYTIYPLEYGMFPEQKGTLMQSHRLGNTLQKKYRGMSDEKVIERAVSDLVTTLMGKRYTRDDNVVLAPCIGLVDGNYQTDAVQSGITLSRQKDVYAAYGRGVGPSDTPMMQLPKRNGEKRSKDMFVPWRMLLDQNRRSTRYVLFCANSIKTFVHRRIRTNVGDPGSFLLPKGDHTGFAQHVSASEFPTELEGPFGKMIEWNVLPGKPDNHLFDTLVGSVVAAGVSGRLKFGESTPPPKPRDKKVSYL